jgi:hypothetical protein
MIFEGTDDQKRLSGQIFRKAFVLGTGIERVLEGEKREYFGGAVKGPKRQRYRFDIKLFPFYVGDINTSTNETTANETVYWEHYDAFMEVFQKRWVLMRLANTAFNVAPDRITRFFSLSPVAANSTSTGMFVEAIESSYTPEYEAGWDKVSITLEATFPLARPRGYQAEFPRFYRGVR